MTRSRRRLVLVFPVLVVAACAGSRPAHLGADTPALAPCPSSPNCVSSDATDAEHAIDAFAIVGAHDAAWRAAVEAVRALPRTAVIEERVDYLHAECTSAIFRYVDDLELQLRRADRTIAVRSASRLGRSDFGVNRARVEMLRETLRARSVVR